MATKTRKFGIYTFEQTLDYGDGSIIYRCRLHDNDGKRLDFDIFQVYDDSAIDMYDQDEDGDFDDYMDDMSVWMWEVDYNNGEKRLHCHWVYDSPDEAFDDCPMADGDFDVDNPMTVFETYSHFAE